MKISLRKKFVFSYVFIIIMVFLLLNTYGQLRIYKNILNESEASLYNEATIISKEYLSGIRLSNASFPVLRRHFMVLNELTDTQILLAMPDSEIVVDSGNTHSFEGKYLNDYDKTFLLNQTVTETDLNHLLTEKSIAVIYPVTLSMETIAYIVLLKPLAPIKNTALQYTDSVILCFIILAVLLMIVFVYLYIQTAMPINAMTTAAKKYADGHFDYPMANFPGKDQSALAGAIRYMADKMSDMNNYQRKFIANVSHDFRSPLTSIKGYTEALLDGTIPQEMQQKYLDIIIFETERLTKLTTSLLTLNQFETGTTPMDISVFDLNYEIKRCSAAFEQRCMEKQISLELIFDRKELMVQADTSKIELVIQNLLDNAVKFSHHNSIIEIHTTEKNRKIFVSVKDHGIGIPKDSINKVWDRFYKTDNSRGRDKKGTGLGLSITKEIIEAHGENINVISTEGAGTEFIFSLPAAPIS